MSVLIGLVREALTITGFVAVMMLVIEYVNVRTRGDWQVRLVQIRWGQYIIAAMLGATPGCLGAFAVVGMYAHGVVTSGAVIAAMIATMGDESFVMLAMLPVEALWIGGILFVLGIGFGALSDAFVGRWRRLEPAPCEGLEIHVEDKGVSSSLRQVLRQWRGCSVIRGVLTAGLCLFLFAMLAGQLGPSEWNWIRVSLLVVFTLALLIVITAQDHFLEEHLWRHVVRTHIPRVLLWTFGALAVIHIFLNQLHLGDEIERGRWVVLLVACLVGLIPESGPHLIFVTLYAQDALPLSVLIASSVVQDGHGMLPLLAHSRRAFIGVKAVNLLAGALVGAAVMLIGW